jgi:signal peptidase I
VEWIKLPYHRYPGVSTMKRYDPIVFNYPAGDTVCDIYQSSINYYDLVREYGRQTVWNDHQNFGNVISHPVDKRENYVKRLIGMPGDSLKIVNGVVYINNEKAYEPENMQFNYTVVTTNGGINKQTLDKYNITEGYRTTDPNTFVLNISAKVADELIKLPYISSVMRNIQAPGQGLNTNLFPNRPDLYPWNVDNFGPIYIPKKGETVKLDVNTLPLYERVIHAYELHNIKVIGDKIFIDEQQADSYTFEMDYYWMMGDNRHNSADSRYWGYVPENHIVGKPVLIWLSRDKENGGIRWKRMFRIPK